MSLLVPVLIAGGGIAWVASQGDQAAPRPPGPTRYTTPTAGSTIKQASQGGATNGAVIDGGTAKSPWVTLYLGPTSSGAGLAAEQKINAASAVALMTSVNPSGWGVGTSSVDPEVQKKLDLIKLAAQKTFNDMDAVAKAKAAEKLNKDLKLDPPLTGHETWGETWQVVAGASATAACAASGYGAAAAPLCGIVAAYLGGLLGDWMQKKWPAIKEWFDSKWGDIEDAASDAYNWFASAF
jgi:hypothetical protein